ncbi:hypothetical protein [Tenacibaculum haliotis]|uniref:hypothetical protein n=1 Tax=Tenacibaculum haliotis TaxID=1888914 RepID=UPI0021AEACDD|nr:hypothetical protein [Tenacibaculum haliotis]MCT4698733.1 hypothetical protein [Tenacibaculum haliotis]
MKKRHFLLGVLITLALSSCEDGIRDITDGGKSTIPPINSSEVIPININNEGFDFLEKMQGHWVGSNKVIADDYPWFAWDYRAISKSHIHGIHEGGSLGNLLTSFFVTNYKNKRTLMARNGGLLSGIYRTSYFVLDKVEDKASEGKYYRFVDAIGGENIMYFELRFKNDELFFNSYTSNLGNRVPSRHMTFKGKKMHLDLAQKAANDVGFPQNLVDEGLDFANGFITENLYNIDVNESPKSATFLAQQSNNDVYELAPQSGDPYQITDHPRLGTLTVNITRNSTITNTNLLVYLSKNAITDENGYLTSNTNAYNTLLHFPNLEKNENNFLFTYIHPGDYYITIIADTNNSASPNEGDILSISKKITILPLENKIENITNIDVQN